jgi:hypothetical protein
MGPSCVFCGSCEPQNHMVDPFVVHVFFLVHMVDPFVVYVFFLVHMNHKWVHHVFLWFT